MVEVWVVVELEALWKQDWAWVEDLVVAWATVCPGSSDPPEKILNIFAPENEVYTIFFLLLRYFRLNIIRLQSKIILGHMNKIV